MLLYKYHNILLNFTSRKQYKYLWNVCLCIICFSYAFTEWRGIYNITSSFHSNPLSTASSSLCLVSVIVPLTSMHESL